MRTWENAAEEIVEFAELGENWDGYGARQLAVETISEAVALAYSLRDKGLPVPSVMAGQGGEVCFEWDKDGHLRHVEYIGGMVDVYENRRDGSESALHKVPVAEFIEGAL